VKNLSLTIMAAVGALAATPALSQVSLSFYTGYQTAPHSVVSGNDIAPGGAGPFSFTAGWDGRSYEMPPYYGFRVTWWKTDNWGFGIDYTHSKVYADDSTLAASGFPILEFTDGLNNLTLNATYRWTNEGSKWQPYVGAGLGVVIPRVEVISAAGGPATDEFQLAGPSAMVNAGISYQLNDRWAVFGEYKGTYSRLTADLTGGGTLKTNIITNALNAGVAFSF
jgi:lipid A oxidase